MTRVPKLTTAATALVGLLLSGTVQPLLAAGLFTNGVPPAGGTQYPTTIPLTGNETIPADTNLGMGLNPASEAITTTQLAAYTKSGPSVGNALIGGDATTNLWQRGTAGVSTTSATPAYDSADRWAQWVPGAAAGVKIARDSTAADLPAGYQYALALTHTNTTGGQVCMGQEIASANSYQFQGQVAEMDFHAATGAGLSAAAPYNLTATIIYGTGADQGISSMAAGTWTGQANASAAVIPLGGVSMLGRYAVVGSIPATATEVGVSFCYTPGTTDTNDYVAFSGVQLVRNASLLSYVNTTLGYNCATALQCTSFQRRPAVDESQMQLAYFWEINETAVGGGAAGVAVSPSGQGASTTSCTVLIPTPVTMRGVPALNFTLNGNAPSASTWTVTHVVTATVLSTPYLAAAAAASTPNLLALTATTGATLTAGQTCILTTTAAGGGVINASAEL